MEEIELLAQKNLETLLDKISKFTLKLVAINNEGLPYQAGSGFLWQRNNQVLLITARHVCYDEKTKKRVPMYIETNYIESNHTLCLPINDMIYEDKKTDVSVFLYIDDTKPTAENFVNSTKKSELVTYKGPVTVPDDDEVYTFSADKALRLSKTHNTGIIILKRYRISEYNIVRKGSLDRDITYFFLQSHNTVEFYKGCSGSPLVGCDGTVYAILTSGKTSSPKQIRFTGALLHKLDTKLTMI